MIAQHAIRVLVVDDEPGQLEDYRRILKPSAAREPESGATDNNLFDRLEGDLFGPALDHKRFPAVDLATATSGRDAIGEVRAAVETGRPFALVFLDMPPGNVTEGLRTAEHLRTLDPELFIVLVSSDSPLHPVELSERIPPADQLLLIKKPVHSHEVQQLFLALGTRWRAEHRFGPARHTGAGRSGGGAVPTESLDELPAAAVLFDRRDRLLAANEAVAELFPELTDLFAMGTPYEELMRQMADRLLPDSTLVRIDSWVKDRLDWHNRTGGVLEQKLRGGRWVLVAESRNRRGETCCIFYETTDLRQRDARKATASHMTQIAQSFGALCRR
ncbi:MAG TPA: PAS-domain containing protein, partial [Kiloniellales bacterium]|nr:PAS-domain containing protein [Kiloniellales bacterium]